MREREHELDSSLDSDTGIREVPLNSAESDEPLLDLAEAPSTTVAPLQPQRSPDASSATRLAFTTQPVVSSSSRPVTAAAALAVSVSDASPSAEPPPAAGECILPLRDGRTFAIALRPDATVALVRLVDLGARAHRSPSSPAYQLHQLLRAHSGLHLTSRLESPRFASRLICSFLFNFYTVLSRYSIVFG